MEKIKVYHVYFTKAGSGVKHDFDYLTDEIGSINSDCEDAEEGDEITVVIEYWDKDKFDNLPEFTGP